MQSPSEWPAEPETALTLRHMAALAASEKESFNGKAIGGDGTNLPRNRGNKKKTVTFQRQNGASEDTNINTGGKMQAVKLPSTTVRRNRTNATSCCGTTSRPGKPQKVLTSKKKKSLTSYQQGYEYGAAMTALNRNDKAQHSGSMGGFDAACAHQRMDGSLSKQSNAKLAAKIKKLVKSAFDQNMKEMPAKLQEAVEKVESELASTVKAAGDQLFNTGNEVIGEISRAIDSGLEALQKASKQQKDILVNEGSEAYQAHVSRLFEERTFQAKHEVELLKKTLDDYAKLILSRTAKEVTQIYRIALQSNLNQLTLSPANQSLLHQKGLTPVYPNTTKLSNTPQGLEKPLVSVSQQVR